MSFENWAPVHDMVYHPVWVPELSPEGLGLDGRRVRGVVAQTADGLALNGWHFTRAGGLGWIQGMGGLDRSGRRESNASSAQQSREPLGIIYFPGRGGHRGYRVLEVELLLQAGAEVLLVDYRGYGENPGWPSEAGLRIDARGAWELAGKLPGWVRGWTVLYGESLGGAVAVGLAAELSRGGTPPAGLVLRSAFTSFTEAARLHQPLWAWLIPSGWYPAVEWIRTVTCPILAVHGELDDVVPIEMGRRLLAAAPAQSATGVPARFVSLPAAGHNGLAISSGPRLLTALSAFLRGIRSPEIGGLGAGGAVQ